MYYRVEFAPLAHRQLRKLERAIQIRLLQRIETLSTNPRPSGVKKLAAEADLYRIRIGEYRVVYQIRDRDLLILIIKMGHRREIYS